MNVEHTAEPWRVGRWLDGGETVGPQDIVIDTDIGPKVILSGNSNFPQEGKADARRAVACVNACEGFETELLESVVALGTTLGQRLAVMGGWSEEEAERQRDELAEAIRLTLDENGHLADGDVCTLKVLKDALSKVSAGGTVTEGHNVELTGAAHKGRIDSDE